MALRRTAEELAGVKTTLKCCFSLLFPSSPKGNHISLEREETDWEFGYWWPVPGLQMVGKDVEFVKKARRLFPCPLLFPLFETHRWLFLCSRHIICRIWDELGQTCNASGDAPRSLSRMRLAQKKQEIFKHFQATTVTNCFNLSLPPSLDSTYKHPWRKSWLRKVGKALSENRPVMWQI